VAETPGPAVTEAEATGAVEAIEPFIGDVLPKKIALRGMV
jgi:hypothetical protein